MELKSSGTKVTIPGTPAGTEVKKPYHAPQLQSYGDMHRLTLAKGAACTDTSGGISKPLRACSS